MKGVLVLLCLVVSFSILGKPYPKVLSVKVIKVLDGNTITVEDSIGESWDFAFANVDAPETGQHGYQEALSFLKKRLKGKKVKLAIDSKDRQGKLRGRVYLRKSNIEKELLQEGLVWLIPPKSQELLPFEEAAEEESIGIWSSDNPQPPWVWRRNMTKQTAKGS